MIYFKSVCNLMYDVSNNTCPLAISDYFVRTRNIHTHNTRRNTSNFYIEHSKLNKLNASFVRFGVKIWNNIPKSVCEVGIKHFNIMLHKSLLTILGLEDDYVDILVITKLIAKLK